MEHGIVCSTYYRDLRIQCISFRAHVPDTCLKTTCWLIVKTVTFTGLAKYFHYMLDVSHFASNDTEVAMVIIFSMQVGTRVF